MSTKQPFIPSRLTTPPTSKVDPPTVSNKQELPFGELSWEDFEKLCLRLVSKDSDVEFCKLYGVRGDKQLGIDIYAKKVGNQKYSVYQCKRENKFGPAKIRAAVKKFEDGEWKSKSDTIVLCTQESLQSKKRSDEVLAHQERLKLEGISLLSWDCHQLSIKLKDCPELVYDFFGRNWLEEFCGKEVVANYQDRLTSKQVGEFRLKLGDFYKTVFNTQDPGLPLVPAEALDSPEIQQRFVIPDVVDQGPIQQSDTEASSVEPQPQSHDPSYYFELQSGMVQVPSQAAHLPRSAEYRRSVEKWLLESDQSLLLGDPGSGKTTLLRYVAIDLLQPEPGLALLSKRWGCFLPVWIPFALWTRLVATRSETSVVDVLRHWLKGFNEESLFPLVEIALRDERLLLLVDGLDEWSNEDAAQIALDRLKVFVEQRNIPVIATSRPRGVERLAVPTNGWSVGRLADFTFDQQKALVATWFTCWNKRDETKQRGHDADSFMSELGRSVDLRELARTPLLLLFLIYHRLHRSALPEGRFKAYESIINHLISSQPKRRRTAANIVGEQTSTSTEDAMNAFARIAFEIQRYKTTGAILKIDAKETLGSYLMDEELGLGLSQPQARKMCDHLLAFGQDEAGLMVHRSSDEIGFYHRTFHEYLAAFYLSQLPLENQIELVGSECQNPQWHETLLCLFQLTRRRDDFEKLVVKLEGVAATASTVGEKTIELVLTEIAFGGLACPPKTSKRIAEKSYRTIERGDWMPHRERLLRLAVNGIRSTTMKESVKQKLKAWFPGRINWRGNVLEAMANWEWSEGLGECLWNGLHDEEFSNQRSAAKAFCAIKKGDRVIGDQLAAFATKHPRVSVRVASLEGLMHGWPGHSSIETAIKLARESSHSDLQLLGIFWRIKQSLHNNDDKQLLMKLSRWGSGLHRFHGEIVQAIVTGWPKDKEFKEACTEAVAQGNGRSAIDNNIAISVLLNGYEDDVDVIEICVNEMRSSGHPFVLIRLSNALEVFRSKFANSRKLIDAVDTWLEGQKFNGPDQMNAALYTRSDRARTKLLQLLTDKSAGWRFWAAEGLLQGWLGDTQAIEQLKAIAAGENKHAAGFSMQLSRIIADREECLDRLIEFMNDDSVNRHDLVVRAIAELGTKDNKFDLIDAALKGVIPKMGDGNIDIASITATLIKQFPDDARIQKLVEKCLDGRIEDFSKPSLALIASSYPKNKVMQQQILAIMSPLSDSLRMVVVQELESLHSDQKFVGGLLSKYDNEFHGEIKTAASIAYHKGLLASREDSSVAIGRLKTSIACYGPDHEARRQAAFCGLTVMKRLDVMIDSKERIGDDRQCSINLFDDSALGPNVPLLHFILSNWAEIRSAFADSFWSRLSKGSEGANKWPVFWNFVDQFPTPCEEALEFIESEQPALDFAGLKFLERSKPKSGLLLRQCLRVLRLGDNSVDASRETAVVASEILGANFSSNSELLDRVNESRSEGHVYGKEVLALCSAWPDQDLLHQAYEQMKGGRVFADEVSVRLICGIGTQDEVVDLIERICRTIRLPNSSFLLFARPIVQRISRDADLAERLVRRLRTDSTDSTKVTVLKLLSAAIGLDSEMRDWCELEMNKQYRIQQVGVDIFTGQFESVEHAILNVHSAASQFP